MRDKELVRALEDIFSVLRSLVLHANFSPDHGDMVAKDLEDLRQIICATGYGDRI